LNSSRPNYRRAGTVRSCSRPFGGCGTACRRPTAPTCTYSGRRNTATRHYRNSACPGRTPCWGPDRRLQFRSPAAPGRPPRRCRPRRALAQDCVGTHRFRVYGRDRRNASGPRRISSFRTTLSSVVGYPRPPWAHRSSAGAARSSRMPSVGTWLVHGERSGFEQREPT